MYKTTRTVDRLSGEEEWELEFDVSPGEAAIMYDSNGTGNPATPASADLVSATKFLTGARQHVKMDPEEWLEYSGYDEQELASEVLSELSDNEDGEYEDACEQEADMARDDGRPARRIRRKKKVWG